MSGYIQTYKLFLSTMRTPNQSPKHQLLQAIKLCFSILKFSVVQNPDSTSPLLLDRKVLQCLHLLNYTIGTLNKFWRVGREGHWRVI